jgi:hypothetical protein
MNTRLRKRAKRAHRSTARKLLRGGTLLNATAPVGSIPWNVAQWHMRQARFL